eukprot:7382113-Pyramimonas_sp.AAC.1
MQRLDSTFHWTSTCYVIREEPRPLPAVDPTIAVCVRARGCHQDGRSFWPPPRRGTGQRAE